MFSLFFFSLSLIPPPPVAGVAVAQRVVTVQSGPLIRTEGSHVTIWCNVTGYKDGVEQDFEWSMYLPSAPDREIRIVSTAQPNYAYSVYAQRVNSKEIYVERLSRDSAVLHITKVLAKDQGLFECYTPNTDGQYLGSYSARTNLTGKSLSTHTHTHTCQSTDEPPVCTDKAHIVTTDARVVTLHTYTQADQDVKTQSRPCLKVPVCVDMNNVCLLINRPRNRSSQTNYLPVL